MNFPIPIIYAVLMVFISQCAICVWMGFLLRQQRAINKRPFWQAFQSAISKSLHHPHPESREMDKLLEQLEALTIDQWGIARLETLLKEKSADINQPDEDRQGAEFLLFTMPLVVKERESLASK